MGSADWMPRNLDKRVEITFPVEDPDLKRKVIEILATQLLDNVKAYLLQPDGTYKKQDLRGKTKIGAQDTFCTLAMERSKEKKRINDRVFVPQLPADEK